LLPHQPQKLFFLNFRPTKPHDTPPPPTPVINNNQFHDSYIDRGVIFNIEAPIVMTLSELSALIAALPESPDVSWGPPATIESALNDVPYAPYSKGDKLGRMADWSAESGKDGRDQRGGRQGYNRNYRGSAPPNLNHDRIQFKLTISWAVECQINRFMEPGHRVSSRTNMLKTRLPSQS
jgi:hypothetical protein